MSSRRAKKYCASPSIRDRSFSSYSLTTVIWKAITGRGRKEGGVPSSGTGRGEGERGVNDGGVGKTLLVCGGFMGEEDIPTTAIQCHSEDEPHRSNHNASSRWKNKHQQSTVVTAMALHVATMVSCSGQWSITQDLNVDAGRCSWRG